MQKRRIVMLCVASLMAAVTVLAAEPGSDQDPIVTKSYLDTVVVPQLEQKMVETSSFSIVNVAAGERIICGEGTEMILRMGTASVIATAKGGVCDATGGFDLQNWMPIAANHLLIIPVGDGRGATASTDCIFMVKGTYQIQKASEAGL